MTSKQEPLVEYNHLGKSGLKVSNLCLGTMTFGKDEGSFIQMFTCPSQSDEEKAHTILDRFTQLGGNFIDTANMYCFGQSERILGTWLKKQKRDDVVIATKVRFPVGPSPNDQGLSRRHIIQSIEESLERLQTNFIDLYQMHFMDDATPIEETLRTFDDLIRCGKVRYFGGSNFPGRSLQKIVDYTKFMGLSRLISLQQHYNLLTRNSEQDEFMVCKEEGIGVLPWGPLRGGLLTGKYNSERKDGTLSRLAYDTEKNAKDSLWSRYSNQQSYLDVMETLEKVANKNEKSIAQVALRWLLQKDVVASLVIGATSIKQLEENMGVGTGWSISKEDMEALDKASQPEVPSFDALFRAGDARFRNNRFHPRPVVQNLF